jgi:hypothetical protein
MSDPHNPNQSFVDFDSVDFEERRSRGGPGGKHTEAVAFFSYRKSGGRQAEPVYCCDIVIPKTLFVAAQFHLPDLKYFDWTIGKPPNDYIIRVTSTRSGLKVDDQSASVRFTLPKNISNQLVQYPKDQKTRIPLHTEVKGNYIFLVLPKTVLKDSPATPKE